MRERRSRSALRASVRIRKRNPVDIARERLEPSLIRMPLARQGHRQQRAAMETVFETNHCWPLRVRTRNLDAVFDGFSPRAQTQSFLCELARVQGLKSFTNGNAPSPPRNTHHNR